MFEPNFGIVELCLTYKCNIKCNNCSNLCTQAPFKGDLTPADVERFINDSINNDHIWGQITLHGGEPVLNPWIFEILELLVNYRKKTNTKLWLLSNNSVTKIREKITRASVEFDIPLGISTKLQDKQMEYIPVNEAPVDLNIQSTVGCFQIQDCGMCYNYLGYFPCSPMAAAARVFDYEPAALSIKDLTKEKCTEYYNKHCPLCGFALVDRRRVKEQMSTWTWINKLNCYNRGNN